jgi:hypothetical protein
MISKKLRKDAVVPIAGALGLRELTRWCEDLRHLDRKMYQNRYITARGKWPSIAFFLLGNSGTTAFWITYALRPDAVS